MKKDYRKNQKVIATLALEDRLQDFTEIDVLENGVILGNSIIFKNGQLTMIGIGTNDGADYTDFSKFKKSPLTPLRYERDLFLYFKNTGEKDPLPWDASTFKYQVLAVKKAKKVNRFMAK